MATWLTVLVALSVYMWTVFGLRPLVIKDVTLLNKEQFKQMYPVYKWVPLLHELLSLPAFLLGLIGGPILADIYCDDTHKVACSVWLAVSILNCFNGLFELLTRVHPDYGLLIKRYSSQSFAFSKEVRKLGAIRIASSGIIWLGLWITTNL